MISDTPYHQVIISFPTGVDPDGLPSQLPFICYIPIRNIPSLMIKGMDDNNGREFPQLRELIQVHGILKPKSSEDYGYLKSPPIGIDRVYVFLSKDPEIMKMR